MRVVFSAGAARANSRGCGNLVDGLGNFFIQFIFHKLAADHQGSCESIPGCLFPWIGCFSKVAAMHGEFCPLPTFLLNVFKIEVLLIKTPSLIFHLIFTLIQN